MKRISLLLFLILIPFSVFADTHTCADCEQATVEAMIADAGVTDNDIIIIPAGTCEWSHISPVNFGTKKITLQGSGTESTIITATDNTEVVLDMGNAGSRVTNFSFEGDINVAGQGFRIDHMNLTYTTITASGANTTDHPEGVIYANTFNNGRTVVIGAASYDWGTGQSTRWHDAIDLGGTDDTVYVEGNNFIKSHNITSNFIDANYGGRYVCRWNTVTTPDGYTNPTYFEVHSLQEPENRGVQKWEIYNNVIVSGVATGFTGMFIRSGTGMIYNNEISSKFTYGIYFDNIRSESTLGEPAGACDGTRTGYDGNTGAGDEAGYPCRDQIGRGYDTDLWVWDAAIENVGAYTQPLLPAHIWNNTRGGVAVNASVDSGGNNSYHIQANRDFYNRAPQEGDPLYPYTAADCPHVLTGLTGRCDSSIAGHTGYNITGNFGLGSGPAFQFTGPAITLN